MDKYQVSEDIIVRTPLLSLDEAQQFEVINDDILLLKRIYANPLILEAIAVDSYSLYQAVLRFFENNEGDEKNIAKSCRKIIKRMSSRTTPFGLCAGVDIGKLADSTEFEKNNLENVKKKARVDMAWLYDLLVSVENNTTYWSHIYVKLNTDCYRIGTRLLLPGHRLETQFSKIADNLHGVTSVHYSGAIEKILEFFTGKVFSLSELISFLCNSYPQISDNTVVPFIKNLLSLSILLPELNPPDINTEPLEYVIQVFRERAIDSRIVEKLCRIACLIDTYNACPIGQGIKYFQECQDEMARLYKLQNNRYLQVDMYSLCSKSNLCSIVFEEVNQYVNAFASVAGLFAQNRAIKDFTDNFIERYGYSTLVPVQELLDSDVGLGYPAGYPGTLNKGNMSPSTMIHERLMETILEKMGSASENVISLNQADLVKITQHGEFNYAPNSFEIAFYFVASTDSDVDKGNFRLIASPLIGSTSPFKSFGRFSPLFTTSSSHSLLDSWYYKEEQLAHDRQEKIVEMHELLSDGRLHNLCISNSINQNQLSLSLNLPTESTRIHLKDLVVGVSRIERKLFIQCTKTGERLRFILPNMLTPTLHSNIIRFLSDVTNPSMGSIFAVQGLSYNSNLQYVPRIEFQKIVLSPARWTVAASDFFENTEKISFPIFIERFLKFKSSKGIPDTVCVGSGDRRLLMNLKNPADMQLLFDIIKTSPTYIVEYLGAYGTEEGRDGQFVELVLPVFRQKYELDNSPMDYDNVQMTSTKKSDAVRRAVDFPKRNLFVGQDGWWYFKLYYGTSAVDNFLIKKIYPICSALKKNNRIDKLFFIRYGDPKPHIRLRLHFTENAIDGCRLSSILNELHYEKWISECRIETYEREIERYGGMRLIESVETFFYYDSLYTFELLKEYSEKSDIERTMVCLFSVYKLLETCGFSLVNIEEILSTSRQDEKNYRKIYRSNSVEYMSIVSKNEYSEKKFLFNGTLLDMFFQRQAAALSYWNAVCYEEHTQGLTCESEQILFSLTHMFCNRFMGDVRKERLVMSLLRFAVHDVNQKRKHGISV